MTTNLQHCFDNDAEFRQLVVLACGWSKLPRPWLPEGEDVEEWLASEYAVPHDWECDRSAVLTSYPPKYMWKCRKCGKTATRFCTEGEPPLEGCTGVPEAGESIRKNDSYNLGAAKGSITYSPAQNSVAIGSGNGSALDRCSSCELHGIISDYRKRVARCEMEASKRGNALRATADGLMEIANAITSSISTEDNL